MVRGADEDDARQRFESLGEEHGLDGEKRDNPNFSSDEDEKTIVSWDENDPEDPYNWSQVRDILLRIVTILTIPACSPKSS